MRSVVLVLAVWLAGLGAAAQFGKISVAWDLLAVRYEGASPVALGLIVSVVGVVGLVFGTTAGLILARLGARRVMVGCLAAGAAVSLVQAGLPGYGAMLVLRVVEGFSHLGIVVAAPVVIAGTATGRHQGLAMTLWSSFFGLTYAILAVLAPPVMAAGGVAALFLGHAGWMAAMAVLLAVLLPPDRAAAAEGPRRGLLARHLAIYASPRIGAVGLGFVFYTMIYVAVLTLVPPLLPEAQRVAVAALMPLSSIIVSLTLGVWALRVVPAVRLAQLGYMAGAAGAALFLLAPAAGALLLSGALGIAQGAHFAAIPQLNASAPDRAAAAGSIAQMGNLGTTTGTPVLAALLAAAGPAGVTLFALPLCLGGIAMHAWLTRRRRVIG